MNRIEKIDALTRNADALTPHFELSADDLARSYGDGKWTVRQLLAHLADCEFVNLYRFCKGVAEPACNVDVFEEGQWAVELCYAERDALALGALFSGARNMLIQHTRMLSDEALERTSSHPEKGSMSGNDWIELAVGHVSHHLSQIDAALAGAPWVKPTIQNSHRFGA